VSGDWDGPLAILAAVSIAVGNVGALGQDSLKRLLGYSGVAQAGYMLGGVVVASEVGINALIFYLAAYGLMNMAAFAAIVARERETPFGDDIRAVRGIGRERPLLAWPLTIGMLALAGLPGTAGFIGKLYLIEALVEDGYTWLGVAIVVGTMISLAYYLRVVAAVWMQPAEDIAAKPIPAAAGGSPEADAGALPDPNRGTPRALGAGRCAMVVGPAILCAAATVFFGVIPSPLVDWAEDAGSSVATFLP
jgi:NADH-quinone oxidoreductase subunit N